MLGENATLHDFNTSIRPRNRSALPLNKEEELEQQVTNIHPILYIELYGKIVKKKDTLFGGLHKQFKIFKYYIN